MEAVDLIHRLAQLVHFGRDLWHELATRQVGLRCALLRRVLERLPASRQRDCFPAERSSRFYQILVVLHVSEWSFRQ